MSVFLNFFTSLFSPNPNRFDFCGPDDEDCLDVAETIWRETQDAANAANQSCRFTTFSGYEWTGNTAGANLHRNVIFGNATVPSLPVSYLDEPVAEELWRTLEQQCTRAGTGCDAIVRRPWNRLSSPLPNPRSCATIGESATAGRRPTRKSKPWWTPGRPKSCSFVKLDASASIGATW